jgi:hypothetical protein
LIPLVSAGGRPPHGHLVARSDDVVAHESEIRKHGMVTIDDLFDPREAGSLPWLQIVVDDFTMEEAIRQSVRSADVPHPYVVLGDGSQIDIYESS